MEIKKTGNHVVIKLDSPTTEINLYTSSTADLKVSQDTLKRVHITIR